MVNAERTTWVLWFTRSRLRAFRREQARAIIGGLRRRLEVFDSLQAIDAKDKARLYRAVRRHEGRLAKSLHWQELVTRTAGNSVSVAVGVLFFVVPLWLERFG